MAKGKRSEARRTRVCAGAGAGAGAEAGTRAGEVAVAGAGAGRGAGAGAAAGEEGAAESLLGTQRYRAKVWTTRVRQDKAAGTSLFFSPT